MRRTCSNCHLPLAVDDCLSGRDVTCPACGAPIASSGQACGSDNLIAPESERDLWLQQRRRSTVSIALSILVLLALLSLLLVHPSTAASPARQAKNAIFGQRVTEAVEQAVQQGGQQGEGQGEQGQGRKGQGQQGRGQQGQGRQGQGQQGQSGGQGQGSAGQTGASTAGTQGGGRDSGDRGRGTGSSRNGGADSPANPQHPENNGPDLDAPEERSIGWLDRFFGVQRGESSGPVRAGEGGTGDAPGAGNTNATTATAPGTVASEFTQRDDPRTTVSDLETPPSARPRLTNRVAAATNTTLKDNMELLLRQNRAGSGDVRISLMWNNRNDLDLHVVDPRGEEIYYQHRRAASGGLLDIDMNSGGNLQSPAVENVYWPERGAPLGTYRIFVNHYRQHDRPNDTAFTVRVLIRGRTTDFPGTIRFGEPKRLVHQFTLGPAGGG